jgi:hypothetical protein
MTIYDSHNEWTQEQPKLRTLHEVLTTSKNDSVYENSEQFPSYSLMKPDFDFSQQRVPSN